MLQVTADIFSGRPNPTWMLDEASGSEVMRDLAARRSAVGTVGSGWQHLGYRGFVLSVLDDSSSERYDLPTEFRIAGGGAADESRGFEIAERLIEQMPVEEGAESAESSMSAGVRDLLREQIASPPFAMPPAEATGPLHLPEPLAGIEHTATEQAADAQAAACPYWATRFNPGFWNNDASVQRSNNCYNYAVNRRTDTFAQPGRAHGFSAQMSCGGVVQGAGLDGARWWGNCFPPGTGGIWIMALVVAPGYDYHWYRYSAEGFWGHKPGQTAARNYDNNGNTVLSPYTAARQPYTNFCGYLQCSYGMVIT